RSPGAWRCRATMNVGRSRPCGESRERRRHRERMGDRIDNHGCKSRPWRICWLVGAVQNCSKGHRSRKGDRIDQKQKREEERNLHGHLEKLECGTDEIIPTG